MRYFGTLTGSKLAVSVLGTAVMLASAAPVWAAPAAPKTAKPKAAAPAKPAAPATPAKPAAPAPAKTDEDLYGPGMSAPPGAKPQPQPAVPDNEPRTVIREIEVRGNQRISDIRIQLSIPITVGDKVTRADIMDAIQRIYGMGFFQDVKAGSEPVAGGERLIFNVVENPVMGDVTFEGVTKVDAKKLEEIFQPMKGDIINYNTIKESVDKIQKLYGEAGYPLARVADMGVRPGGILVLRIAEGKVHSIKVTGNEETKEYVVLRELSTKPGEIFSSEKIKGDLRRVYNLNYFEELNLKFEPAPAASPDEVIVVIDVKEKQTGSINLGAGYSTREGILGMFSVKKDNLFGTGQQVGADLSVSQQFRVAGELTYFNPWVDDNRTGLGGSLFVRRFNNFLGDFREDRMGASVNASRPLFGDSLASPWRGTVGLRGERITTFDNLWVGGNVKPTYPNGERITLDPSGTDSIFSVSGGVTYDTRDVIANPTEGWFNSLSLEPGLINGGTGLLRSNGTLSYFIPMPALPWAPSERSTIALSTRFGVINTLNGTGVPAYERFFSTGQYLVRGWPEWVTPGMAIAQAFPRNFFQGSNAFVGTAEYRFPIFNIVSGAFFGDTGMFWDTWSLADPTTGMNLLHSGYGLGLRLTTPLGPIRLDYGLREANLANGQFHFGIGQKF